MRRLGSVRGTHAPMPRLRDGSPPLKPLFGCKCRTVCHARDTADSQSRPVRRSSRRQGRGRPRVRVDGGARVQSAAPLALSRYRDGTRSGTLFGRDHPVALATRRLHEALGRPDRVRARLRRDPNGRPARRAARAGSGPARDGAARRLGQPRRPPGRLLRRRVGRPAASAAAAHLGRRDPGRPAVLDPGGLPGRRAPDRAAVRRRVPRGLPWGALRCRLSGLRPVAHRGRSRRRGQQQAGHELIARRDRWPGPRRGPRAADRRAVRDPRRRDLLCRFGDLAER